MHNNCTVFKIIAHPKELEEKIGYSIINELQYDTNTTDNHCRFTKGETYTHLLMCIYSKFEGLYRWGLVTKEESLDEILIFQQLLLLRQKDVTPSCIPVISPIVCDELSRATVLKPVCRAYFKLVEIFENYFPQWSWSFKNVSKYSSSSSSPPVNIAIDIGASPGGWSQYLVSHVDCKKVLAIDPGDLDRELLIRYPEIQHIAVPVQDTRVQTCIKTMLTTLQGDRCHPEVSTLHLTNYFIVCDMNCDAKQSSELLCKYILPHFLPPAGRTCDSLPTNTVVYIILTLKLHKHPKQSNIHHAVKIAMDSFIQLGCMPIYTTPSVCSDIQPVGSSVGSNTDVVAGSVNDYVKCIHVNANSLNERMLICKYYI